jgi:predicted double-glycine peptidase
LLPVPLVRQAVPHTCGAAALMSILFYYQRYDGGESALATRLGSTPEDGTHPASIVSVASAYGLRATLRQGVTVADLRAALERREPVIVDLQAWTDDPSHVRWRDAWEDGHYVVAIGLDADRLYVMDPSTAGRYAFVPLSELLDRWHDYETVAGRRVEYRRMAIFFTGGTPPNEPLQPSLMQ